MSRVEREFEEQRASNESGLPHFEDFRAHREKLTSLVEASERVDEVFGARRLCVLGAGNAYDLDLERLLASYDEIHLVDIDDAALDRARQRLPLRARPRLLLHGRVDLSGMFHDIERYAALKVTPQELGAAPAAGAERIASALPGCFDVVVSTCLLTQLQLELLHLVGDRHPLFITLREQLTMTHLRTLARLTRPGGSALLATDLCESVVFPPGRPSSDSDLKPLMQELIERGLVIHSSHPALIRFTLGDDPVLSRAFGRAALTDPWLWQNGPEHRFLVYGLCLPRRPENSGQS